jgi:FlaA1/EpsC-like NDP-sugar epimerase
MFLPNLIPRNFAALVHDTLMAAASFWLALYLRLGPRMFSYAEDYLLEASGAFALLVLALLLYTRSYRRVWRYSSLFDLLALVRLGSVAIVLFYVGMFFITRLEHLPRSVPAIHWMCLMACWCAGRVLWRALHERSLFSSMMRSQSRVPVLLIGATPQAEMFIRESARAAEFPYLAVGLVDDDPRQQGREIHHVRIYGAITEIDQILRKLARKGRSPQRLILTDPSTNAASLDVLLAVAEAHNLTLARLPSLVELQAGERVHSIRPVAVEDILGRPQVALDRDAMRTLVAGKRVLVTGGGGSIGSELVRQVVGYGPASILLYEQNEYALYEIDRQVATLAPKLPRTATIGDVRDAEQLQRCFADYKPQLVFHAAAIKHVPLSEANPEQAILTNILGSKQVADACVTHGVEAMVQISTDKAVNPTSVMGASKRAAEIYGQMLAQDGATTRFITVRFGNVLNSAGSVVPLFQQQIAAGGPVTVTHKDMVRYFMTIAEAVQLVLQAAAQGVAGAERAPIFVLDMGAPVKIEALAQQMIRLAGLRPGTDIEIRFTGLRPGEKLFEELFHDAENLAPTAHQSIRLAQARTLDRVALLRAIGEVVSHARSGDAGALRPLLQSIVPEYHFS